MKFLQKQKIFKVIMLALLLFICLNINLKVNAADRGEIQFGNVYSYTLEEANESDVYEFTINQKGYVKYTLKYNTKLKYFLGIYSKTETGNLELIREDEIYSYKETLDGYMTQSVYGVRIPAGNYVIKLYSQATSANRYEYSLNFAYTPEGPEAETEFNDKAVNANEISFDNTIIGNMGYDKDVDYYKINVPGSGFLSTEFEHYVESDYKVYLYQLKSTGELSEIANMNVDFTGQASGDYVNENIGTYYVTSGTYYLRVEQWTGYSAIDFQVHKCSSADYKLKTSFKINRVSLSRVFLSAKNVKKKSIKLVWSYDAQADKYQIVYATNKRFKGKKTCYSNKLSKKIKKLKKNKTYYIKVRSMAYDESLGKVVYGKFSKIKKVKIKK